MVIDNTIENERTKLWSEKNKGLKSSDFPMRSIEGQYSINKNR